MSLRRGLALGLTVVAMATVGPGAAAASAASSAGAHAASEPTICVALVVDGRALGSDVSTDCAKVPKGATGVDVLEAAGHTVGFRSDGLLCAIDGLPKSGCADVTDTHYWAYFHRAPNSTKWVYSTEGPSTYEPVNKSTDGWVYDDGSTRTPDNVPYADICKPSTSPSPKASASTRASKQTPTPTASAHPGGTASPASTAPTNRALNRQHHSRAPAILRATAKPLFAAPSAPGLVQAGATRTSGHTDWIPIVIAVVAIAVIAGLAIRRFRRSGGVL